MGQQVVVTDGTDSFYATRTVFQALYDHGDFDKITALSTSIAEAKKMLISRQARYSGLIDVLDFSEATPAEAMAGADVWLAINAKASALPAQLEAAKAAGVTRAMIHLCSDDPEDSSLDAAALEGVLGSSGVTYTLLRTGTLAEKGAGAGIKLGELDLPVCDDVPKEDIFRFVVESLTIPDAYGRSFSLCPSSDDSQLKEMRFAGCSRREEVEALLKGVIVEKAAAEEAAAEDAPTAEEEAKSKAEEEASREDELKMLLQRAKEKGIENQKRMKEEEEAKAALREERAMYFKSTGGDDDDDKKDDDGGEEEPPPPPPADEPKKSDDDDGLALA